MKFNIPKRFKVGGLDYEVNLVEHIGTSDDFGVHYCDGQIDIEKACEWFEKYLTEIGYPDDWCRDSEVQESGEKRFRKAMEE